MKANVERGRGRARIKVDRLYLCYTARERDEDTGTPRHATESVGKRHTGRQFNCINGKGGRRKKESKEREKAKMRPYIRFLAWPAAACLAALWVVHNAQLRRRPFDSALWFGSFSSENVSEELQQQRRLILWWTVSNASAAAAPKVLLLFKSFFPSSFLPSLLLLLLILSENIFL